MGYVSYLVYYYLNYKQSFYIVVYNCIIMFVKNIVNLIILNEKKQVLLAKRSLNDSQGGKWSIPGGGVESNEIFEEALHREIEEELGCNIKSFSYFKSYCITNNEIILRPLYFYGGIIGDIKLNHELSEYKWFNIDSDLFNLDLAFNQNIVLKEFIEFLNHN
jgi:8-oxo-dGTP diphosphatase